MNNELLIGLSIALATTPICLAFGFIAWLSYKQQRSLTHALIASNNHEYKYLEQGSLPPEEPIQEKQPEVVLDASDLSEEQWAEFEQST